MIQVGRVPTDRPTDREELAQNHHERGGRARERKRWNGSGRGWSPIQFQRQGADRKNRDYVQHQYTRQDHSQISRYKFNFHIAKYGYTRMKAVEEKKSLRRRGIKLARGVAVASTNRTNETNRVHPTDHPKKSLPWVPTTKVSRLTK